MTGEVCHIVIKQPDHVITGTGDMIYIHQDMEAMEEYLSWYLSNHVGNLITIRPTYRWSGTRTLNVPMWEWFVRLMKELKLHYVLMADGREVQGLSTQPDDKMLAGTGYLGRQQHERDGAQYYWGQRQASTPTIEQFEDMMYFACKEDWEHTSSRWDASHLIYDDDKVYIYSNRNLPHDYAKAHELSVANLSRNRQSRDVRHTGPSCMFSYLLEAGYPWLGAETMYTTMEPLMGFLRGVAKEHGMTSYGVHHALQWSSTPHECEEHYLRYRLALYVAYLLGATDINTEEGLWHLEEYYEHHHRFGNACRNHLKHQQDFFRYVSSHSRTGEWYAPGALLHGRDDGVTFFGKHQTWGILKQPSLAEESWDLLKCLYPLAKPNQSVYVHGCPTDTPQGYHSGTPYGNFDILPAESREETLSQYRSLAFLGYHHNTLEDAQKLTSYLENGGNLLLTDAHLTCTTDMGAVQTGALQFLACDLLKTDGAPEFAEDTLHGISCQVCTNIQTPDEILLTTDSGTPLFCRYAVGKGNLYVFHTKEYPAHNAIRGAYEAALTSLMQKTQAKEPVWISCKEDVEFAMYRQPNGDRHCYLIAVDWYHPAELLRHALLRVEDESYEITLPFGVMLKCVCHDNMAVWAESEDGEVLAIDATGIQVQGTGEVTFCIAKDGRVICHTIDFSGNPVQKIGM